MSRTRSRSSAARTPGTGGRPADLGRAPDRLRFLSWNVNGLRACAQKGFAGWLASAGADVVGLQEVRARAEDLPPALARPDGWFAHHVAAQRAGYSGVALLAKLEPDAVETSLGDSRFDAEGRLQVARFGRLVIVNVYVPNGSGRDRDNSRVPFKLDFQQALLERLSTWRRGGRRVLVMGDFNTAHREIDLARPKENAKTSGCLPEERAEFGRWLDAGFVDTFRAFESGPGHYSWWSQRFGVRARNIGWRIDYVLASRSAMPFVRAAFLQPQVTGSDHCPAGVDLDPAILR